MHPLPPSLHLEFVLDGVRYALGADRVMEVSLRVRITPLAGAPGPVLGVVNYRGSAVAVLALRRRFGHAPRAALRDDHLIFVRGQQRVLGLLVDRVEGLRAIEPEQVAATPASAPHLQAVVALPDGVLLIHDPDRALTVDEDRALTEALRQLRGGAG